MNALPTWTALYSLLEEEQIWMLKVAGMVLVVGLLVGAVWTLWDVLRSLVVFDEDPQPAATLAGVTIVRPRVAPKSPAKSVGPSEPVKAVQFSDGSDLLGLRADVS